MMADIGEIVDSKFDMALQMSLEGFDSIHTSTPTIWPPSEAIALDSNMGTESRCLLSRPCIGSPSLTINGIKISSFGVEIPRYEGDKRRFEELPPEAIEGNIFVIGTRPDRSIHIEGGISPVWLSVEGLCFALSGMRVAESIPLVNQ